MYSESTTDVVSRNRGKRKSSFVARSESFLPRTEQDGKPRLYGFGEFVTMDSNARESKRRKTSRTFSLAGAPDSASTHDESDEQIVCIPVVQQRFPCSACNKSFMRINHLRRHAREAEDETHQTFWSLLNRSQCLDCRGHFKNSAGLKKHKRVPCKLRAQIEFVESKPGKVAWEEDSPDDHDRGSKGAQQSFASNGSDIQGETEGKDLCATARSWEEQGQHLLANTIPWATGGWNDATYLHPLEEQDEFPTTSIIPLIREDWDNAVYQSIAANTIPWPPRDWVSGTYSRSPEERHEFTTANTVPWSTKDWDNAVYQSTSAATIPWPMKDWEFEAYVYLLEEQNLDNAANHFPTSNTIPWATEDSYRHPQGG